MRNKPCIDVNKHSLIIKDIHQVLDTIWSSFLKKAFRYLGILLT